MKNKRLTSISIFTIILVLSILLFPYKTLSQVTIIVGNGFGPPGSSENEVVINLDNQNDNILGIQLDLCDENDYLIVNNIETTSRTEGFSCEYNELSNGCIRIILFSMNLNPI